ncbi:hypothetical protein [Roseisalinus antarcticus]|uniref:Uncharacterized protein n=1 Tax=Roseisalinus antarcticus TaxID=254357 RepID=A0A1Y5U065_9RHOB|nr:hypothetical protein [Roseisalinus antarcticus]SLN75261.1 hypothetical protein ROA7023_03929 [Roseisalinus antarcticus]
MRPVLLAVIIVSLLGVRISAADEPPSDETSTVLQNLDEIRLDPASKEDIAEVYAELENGMSNALELLSRDGDFGQRLSKLHATAENRRNTWLRRCEASNSERDCERVQAWEERLYWAIQDIDALESLEAEAALVLQQLKDDKAEVLALLGTDSGLAIFEDSILAVKKFLESIELVQRRASQ